MEILNILLVILFGGFFIWRLISLYKNNPEMFTKQNFGKSFYTLGLLGLVLLVAVGFVVLMLNS